MFTGVTERPGLAFSQVLQSIHQTRNNSASLYTPSEENVNGGKDRNAQRSNVRRLIRASISNQAEPKLLRVSPKCFM